MARILGIGTDITECLRIARMIERHGVAGRLSVAPPG